MEEENQMGTFVTDIQDAQKAQSVRTDKIETDLKEQQGTVTRLIKEYRIVHKTLSESLETTKNEQEQLKQKVDSFTDEWCVKFDQSLDKMGRMIDRGNTVINTFPDKMKMEIKHRFDRRTKAVVITIASSLIITAISLGLWSSSYAENNRLQANDLKYRRLQLEWSGAFDLDTLYSNDPDKFREDVQQKEAERRALAVAETAASEKDREAKEAKEKLKKLQQPKPKKPEK